MAETVVTYSEAPYFAGLEVGRTIGLFRRYVHVEQGCVRALAGWFLKAPPWETKVQLGYCLFSHAERVYELQGRLEELRGGNRHVNIEPALDTFAEELVNAPDTRSFVEGIAFVLGQLARAYSEHLGAANPAANAKEIRILQRHAPDVERELAELGKLQVAAAGPVAGRWVDCVRSLLDIAGGIGGTEPATAARAPAPGSRHFEWPSPMVFDERLRHADLGSYESKLGLPLRERCIGEFEVYFNELYAAALAATVIYDSWKMSAPRQFFMDVAHHFWDEVRHCEFGAIRLRALGVEPANVNMMLYDQAKAMPMLHRYCYLTFGLEVFFMPRKPVRVRYYAEQGDALSQLFADVDWSEEVNHVRYGKRWVEHFLENDSRTIEDIQAEIAEYLKQYTELLPGGKKAPW